MKATFETLWAWAVAHDWTATIAAFAVKSTLVLLGVWLLLRLWRGTSAAMRHWVWSLALVSLFLLPLRPTKFAIWSVPMWQRSPGLTANNELASVTGEVRKQNVTASPTPVLADVTPVPSPSKTASRFTSYFSFSATLACVWLGGFVFLLSRFLIARLKVFRLEKAAYPIVDEQFCSALAEVRAELRLRREVRLLHSASSLLPMTWGMGRPIVLLPDEAKSWSAERLQIVLRHELAHVKRRDCLVQAMVQLACAFGWFNPLVWFAACQVRIERERACDDLVLESGAKPSCYADHLLDISRSFTSNWSANSAAIAIAHKPQIADRIVAIVDARRNRRPVTVLMSAATILAVTALLAALSLFRLHAQLADDAKEKDLTGKFDRLNPFFASKERQARDLLKAESPTNQPSPMIWKYFASAADGDWRSVTNYYWQMRSRAYQFSETTNSDAGLENTAWQPVNETYGIVGLDLFGNVEDNLAFGRDVIDSIPAGSIYFGGTDPGRWIVTAMSKSHVNADPFFTLTQNALSDGLYLKYLRLMYGGRIYIPTDDESKAAFEDYTADAQARMGKGQLRPGEDIKIVDGKAKASGQVAVMAINALLAKTIFDKNPDREFYIEESFPLDWMYPHLTPNGLVMKLNRQPLREIPEDVLRADHDYWTRYVVRHIGDWLRDDTSVAEICRRIEQTYAGKEILRDSKPPFRVSFPSGLMFAKLRSSIAGVYAWRATRAAVPSRTGLGNDNSPSPNAAEKERMTKAADFAFRQAYALAPHSPEALYRYIQLLAGDRRFDEAILLARTSSKIEPSNPGLERLVEELEKLRRSSGVNIQRDTDLRSLEADYQADPFNLAIATKLAQKYASMGRNNDTLRIADAFVANPNSDAAAITFAAQIWGIFRNLKPRWRAG